MRWSRVGCIIFRLFVAQLMDMKLVAVLILKWEVIKGTIDRFLARKGVTIENKANSMKKKCYEYMRMMKLVKLRNNIF